MKPIVLTIVAALAATAFSEPYVMRRDVTDVEDIIGTWNGDLGAIENYLVSAPTVTDFTVLNTLASTTAALVAEMFRSINQLCDIHELEGSFNQDGVDACTGLLAVISPSLSQSLMVATNGITAVATVEDAVPLINQASSVLCNQLPNMGLVWKNALEVFEIDPFVPSVQNSLSGCTSVPATLP